MEETVGKKGTITLPKEMWEMIGISAGDSVNLKLEGDKIIITNATDMWQQIDVEYLYNQAKKFKNQDDYHKGFADALRIILRKREDNED